MRARESASGRGSQSPAAAPRDSLQLPERLRNSCLPSCFPSDSAGLVTLVQLPPDLDRGPRHQPLASPRSLRSKRSTQACPPPRSPTRPARRRHAGARLRSSSAHTPSRRAVRTLRRTLGRVLPAAPNKPLAAPTSPRRRGRGARRRGSAAAPPLTPPLGPGLTQPARRARTRARPRPGRLREGPRAATMPRGARPGTPPSRPSRPGPGAHRVPRNLKLFRPPPSPPAQHQGVHPAPGPSPRASHPTGRRPPAQTAVSTPPSPTCPGGANERRGARRNPEGLAPRSLRAGAAKTCVF